MSSASETNHRLLVEFLGREFARREGRICTEVCLVQAQPGSKGRDLQTWYREENPALFENLGNVEQLASQMLDLAEKDAATLASGRYRYEVRTTQHLRGTARVAFQVIVSADDEFPGIDEQPDSKGAVAQQMRHAEWAIRAVMQMAQSVTGVQQQQIRQLADDNHRMAGDRIRILGQLEASRTEETERTMAIISNERADDRKDQVLQKLLPLAPIALSRFVSKDAPPGAGAGGSVLSQIVLALVKSLKEEQVMKLAASFSLEQQLLFSEMIKIVQTMETAERAKEGAANQGGQATANASQASP